MFTELDPLGTGRVKPYVDKKDFFQDLKNPPKKILKEIISDGTLADASSSYFPTQFPNDKILKSRKIEGISESVKDSSLTGKTYKTDPFENADPFKETDPFQEESFLSSTGFSPIFGTKPSLDEIFDEKASWKFEKFKPFKEENVESNSYSTSFSLFSSSTLKVSLPPERTDTKTHSLSSPNTKINMAVNSLDDLNQRNQTQQINLDKNLTETSENESQVLEEPFVKSEIKTSGPKPDVLKSPFKNKFSSLSSPTETKTEKSVTKLYSSVEVLEATTPDPPPRAKTAVFSIKPPPLPPKKLNQTNVKPPARPPLGEERILHYDHAQQDKVDRINFNEKLKNVKLDGKSSEDNGSSSQHNDTVKVSSEPFFPVLLPPPTRKTSFDSNKTSSKKPADVKTEIAPGTTTGSVLNIKLMQLDSAGLENLAATLGVPSKNIYSMTLQDLTKMLTEKYKSLGGGDQEKKTVDDTFEADFDSNFSKPETESNTTYDKYAVFKELIQSECNEASSFQNQNESEEVNSENFKNSENEIRQPEDPTEDKYAALRQLSLNVQETEKIEDGGKIAEVEEIESDPKKSLSTGNPPETSTISKSTESQTANTNAEYGDWASNTSWLKLSETDKPKEIQTLSSESQFFPLEDDFSDEKKPSSFRDNWATFDKPEFSETTKKKSLENLYENENSPFSSDGKEEEKEIPFHWHQNVGRRKKCKEMCWKDDDESWDDYSPKESICSDESSREDGSPDVDPDNQFENALWTMRDKIPKMKNWKTKGKQQQWIHNDKWQQDETEDEFDDFWRRQKDRSASYETTKRNYWRGKSYDDQKKRYDWCNTWGEHCEDSGGGGGGSRRSHYYGNRRKRSESDHEYRKRYDSDASDKECIWSFQKNYSEPQNRTGKQKSHLYGSSRPFKDCSDYHYGSYGKHRKETSSQKRPNSASECKKNYEKMFSPYYGTHSFNETGDKTYPGKKNITKEEFFNRNPKDVIINKCRSDFEFDITDRRINSNNSNQKFKQNKMRGYLGSPPPGKKDNNYTETGIVEKPETSSTRFRFDSESDNFDKDKISIDTSSKYSFDKSNRWSLTNGKTEEEINTFNPKNTTTDPSFSTAVKTIDKSPKKKSNDNNFDNNKSINCKSSVKNQLSKTSRQDPSSSSSSSTLLRKSDSINIFSRDNDPFEGDDFFSNDS